MNNLEKLAKSCDLLIVESLEMLHVFEETIRVTKNLFERFESVKEEEVKNHFNFSKHLTYLNSYLTITIIDLAVNLKGLSNANSNWERIFFIKNAFLVIFESTNKLDVNKHAFIYQNIKKDYSEFIPKYESFNEKLKLFIQEPHFKLIRKVRNNLSAHIESKFEKYYSIAFSLDGEECGKIIHSFIEILSDLQPILQELQSRINNKNVLINAKYQKLDKNA